MNILLVSQYFSAGGLERMVHLLARSLARDFGCKVVLFSFDLQVDPGLRQRLDKDGLICVHENKDRGFSWKTALTIRSLIRKHGIDVIHTHESAPLIYATTAKMLTGGTIPIVHTQHSFIHLKSRGFIRHYDRLFQYVARHTTVVSEQMREEYVKIGVPRSRVQVVPNGIEFPEKQLNPDEKRDLREQLAVSLSDAQAEKRLSELLQARWLINIARIHPQKGQDHLIRLWGKLPQDVRSKSALLLAGQETSDGELGRIKKLLGEMPDNDRIVLTGRVNNPMEWLQAADVFLSGSEYEGMPLSPLEACGAGLPVVLSDIEGHRLLAQEALFFKFEDPASGAAKTTEAILSLDDAQARAKRLKQAEAVRERHSVKEMARRYLELYRK